MKYIGITSRDINIRFKEHCSSSKTLVSDAIKEFGKDNFMLELLEENIDKSDIDEKERFWINSLNSLYPNGYNKSTGGMKGKDLNKISKDELSESSKGINNSRCDKLILQYDTNGQLLNKFGSSREAARYLGDESKYRSILYCLSGKNKTAQNYIWKYEN